MTKTTPWSEIRARRNFTEADEAEIRDAQHEMDREEAAYTLATLRKHREHTQAQLAELIGIDPTTLSRNEHSIDPRLSTIRASIEALGGRLELIARFEDERVALDL